jgi:exodeoxyribonuclease-3
MEYENDIREYMVKLSENKPVILCGDLNVAHKEIDLKHPKANAGSPGFSNEEREKFTNLLEAGFTDSFRHLYPDLIDQYTWWSYRAGARPRNVGWRIDYFVVSDSVKDKIIDSVIYKDILGSDHCPVGLEIDIC